MHIASVKGTAFVSALQKVLRVRGSNAIMPVLEAVHCKAIKGGLILTCNNLDTAIQSGIKADTKEIGKEFLIPLRAQMILLQLKDAENIEIHNGENLTFMYDDNKFMVPCEKAEDFPKLPDTEIDVRFKVPDAGDFQNLIDGLKKFTSNDDLRPTMTGIHFTNDELAATDAHRLMITKYAASDEAFDIIISKTFINAFPALDGAINVHVGKSHIVAFDKSTKIISRNIDGVFPAVKTVLPKEAHIKLKIERVPLLKNIKLAMNMTDKGTKRLNLRCTHNGYKLSAADNDMTQEIMLKGDVEFTLDKNDDKQFTVSLNGSFLQQQIDQLTDEHVTFECISADKAIVFHEADNTFLIMPLMN